MTQIGKALAFGVTAVMLVAVAGCSKPNSSSSEQTTSEPSNTTTTAAAPPENAAATAAAAEAPTPAPTMVKLDIKDASGAPVSGDPVSGKAVFQQCMTCHTIEPGVNKVGPSLHGIVGRHSGMIPGFNYSTANKGSGKVWTEQELYVYLKDPQKEVPGTYMTFTGVKDDQKRADVIAFLQENTK